MSGKVDIRLRRIRSITLWGAAINLLLMALKVAVGAAVRSSALVADGVHSLSDLLTDFVVLISSRLSHRPPDETHPFGHRKFETIACQLIALILLVASFLIIWKAGVSIYEHKTNFPGFWVLVVAALSVFSKEALFTFTRKVARATQSSSLYANAWHHRTDALSSVAVLIGGIVSLSGWGHADHVASIVVGFMIMAVAGKLLYDGLLELTEHAADEESVQVIEKVLAEEKGVFHWHALRTRKLGHELFVDVHILVNPRLSVQESHRMSMEIEKKIKEKLKYPVNTLIHIEPHVEEMHRK
ncbi:MAG: cation diffusion facilitator family transporter [Candidatus Aminicenantales bacterium]